MILQLAMRSRAFSVSGVHKSRLSISDHKRSCSFTPNSQEGDLKQVQFLKYVDDLLSINE